MKCGPLSKRQAEIAEYVAKGLPDKAISQETGLAMDTICNHIRAAADKLPGGGKPRHKLTCWYFSISLVDDEPKSA